MTKTIEDLFVYLSSGADLLITLLFAIFFKKYRSEKGLWAIALYCTLFLILNSATTFVPHYVVVMIYMLFTYLEYIAFTYFLYTYIQNAAFKKGIIITSSIFLVLLTVFDATVTTIKNIDSIPIGVETIIILLFSFYYLYEQMNDTKNLFIYSKFQFWIVTGIMIYLAGSFFIYIFANQLDRNFVEKYWYVTNIFYIIKNIFFAVAFLLYVKHHKQDQHPLTQKFHPYLN